MCESQVKSQVNKSWKFILTSHKQVNVVIGESNCKSAILVTFADSSRVTWLESDMSAILHRWRIYVDICDIYDECAQYNTIYMQYTYMQCNICTSKVYTCDN